MALDAHFRMFVFLQEEERLCQFNQYYNSAIVYLKSFEIKLVLQEIVLT